MKKVLTFVITFAIRLLFWLREVLLRHGWIDVQTPRDIYIHLHAARAQRAGDDIQKCILKSHEICQRFAMISISDDALVDEFRAAGFVLDEHESTKIYHIRW
jgi:hypothetical protein